MIKNELLSLAKKGSYLQKRHQKKNVLILGHAIVLHYAPIYLITKQHILLAHTCIIKILNLYCMLMYVGSGSYHDTTIYILIW